MLRIGFYPYDYLDNWEKFSETSLPEKEGFYSHSNMKDITDADYARTQKSLWRFWNKKFMFFVCFDVQNNTLLADVFQDFQNMSWNI